MDYEVNDDIYCYKNSTVLINKFNIKTKEKFINLESDLTMLKLLQIDESKINEEMNIDFLKGLHRYIFEDIFEWAGELRTVRIHKGTTTFAYPENIENELHKLFRQLKNENYLRNLGMDKISERLAYYKAELNIIHPFREGNGRVVRKFIEILSARAGYELKFINLNRDEYIDIMVKSVLDTTILAGYIRGLIGELN